MVNGQVHVHGRGRWNGRAGPGGLQSLEFMEIPEKRPLKAILVASYLVEDIWFWKCQPTDVSVQPQRPSPLALYEKHAIVFFSRTSASSSRRLHRPKVRVEISFRATVFWWAYYPELI